MDTVSVFSEALARLNVPCDGQTAENLAIYHTLLEDWNTRMNLTGDASLETALDRLYLDSLAPLGLEGLFPQGASLIDVGTGAGFPGMVLAIARPDLQVTLLDSIGKRLTFLEEVRNQLGLGNVRLLHTRAEDAARDPVLREHFQIAVARAVAPLNVLCELLMPFLRIGGWMAAYKGPSAAEEVPAAEKALRLLGGRELSLIPVALPSQPEWQHVIAKAVKCHSTDRRYPRKAGVPAREPLGKVP